jgi:hypothetical protein
MTRKLSKSVATLLLVWTLPALALVDPVPTALITPGWMATINVWVAKDNNYRALCKGALIAPNWILSTGLCLADPNHYLDGLYNGDSPEFYVKLGPNADGIEVDKYYLSDDYRIGLFHIALSSAATPLGLSTKTAAQLQGSELTIFGQQKSLAVYHSYYNPGVDAAAASCRLNGAEFNIEGAFCYLQTKTTASFTLYRTTGTVIDPLAVTAPATPLDKAVRLDFSGKQLYLDFRASKSYPCLEDIGSPVLQKMSDGTYEIAGLVAAVGMADALPVCGMSLANVFVSADAIRAFAAQIQLAWDFSAHCPLTPKPALTYVGTNGVVVRWPGIAGATGYKVFYSPLNGQLAAVAGTIDVKLQTSFTVTLPQGSEYKLAVSAYNADCTGTPSKPLAINVDVH